MKTLDDIEVAFTNINGATIGVGDLNLVEAVRVLTSELQKLKRAHCAHCGRDCCEEDHEGSVV